MLKRTVDECRTACEQLASVLSLETAVMLRALHGDYRCEPVNVGRSIDELESAVSTLQANLRNWRLANNLAVEQRYGAARAARAAGGGV